MDVDTITVITIAIAVAASGIAYFFFSRARMLAVTVDDARARIGGSPPKRSWRRAEALDETLQTLERSTSQAQRERSQLAGALQAAGEGIVITDDHGVAVFANHAADQFLGARGGEEVAEPRLRDAIEEAILNRSSVSTEVELFTPVRRILEIGAFPLDFGVESVGAVAYIRDVTEQRRVDAIRRDFISNVGHELKTPLSALAVLAETIAGDLEGAKGTERMARRLTAEANRLSGLVEDILDLSQAEALASRDHPVHASALTASVAEAMQSAATERGVELIIEDPPADARMSGDLQQLRSMLVNLVDNAINHSEPAEGRPPPRVWLRTSIRTGSIVFDVQDEGIGIPEDHIDRVFERFYRVDRERSPASGGTGLGLSIVKHVARNHGGDVTVMSKPGEGTIFTVTLPLWSE